MKLLTIWFIVVQSFLPDGVATKDVGANDLNAYNPYGDTREFTSEADCMDALPGFRPRPLPLPNSRRAISCVVKWK